MEGGLLRNFFLTNIRIKLLALVFAVALWFFVAGQSDTEIGFLVPLGFKSIPKDMVMTSSPPEDVEVRVMGPSFIINNLSSSQISVDKDLSGAKEGLNTYTITPRDIATPTGVEVVRVRPSSIEVRMDILMEANLPVKARIDGRPAAGFRVADVSVDPKSVKVSGTKKDLKGTTAVYTMPVEISGLSQTRVLGAQLDVSELDLRSISATAVNVKVKIERER